MQPRLKLPRFDGHPIAFAKKVPDARKSPAIPPGVQGADLRARARQADRDEGRRADGLTSVEREELRRLRRENKNLRIKREILGKAAAWFARETGSIPPKGSDS